jgi:DNA-binding response OmpR family regulator
MLLLSYEINDGCFKINNMRRILAVDDNDDILDVLKLVLEDSGYEVETLSDGHLLLETIEHQTPDLILLDIMLGNMDGRELCKTVKENDGTNNIPVILISASHNVPYSSSKERGAPDDFLAKPFDITTLIDKIRTHLNAA